MRSRREDAGRGERARSGRGASPGAPGPESLQSKLDRLEARLARLEARFEDPSDAVLSLLRRRGLRVHSWNPTDAILLPGAAPPEVSQKFFRLLHKYSFRLFLRDVIKLRRFHPADLADYAGERTVLSYLDCLAAADMLVARPGGAMALARDPVVSFGETLEWFVAQLLQREYGAPAIWSVRLNGTRTGGDYDVLAAAEGRLIYIEVKSSPPKHVVVEEVAAFLDRVEALAPAGAVFLEDTGLRMFDKIVPMFADALAARGLPPPKRIQGELFSAGDRVLIANSKPDLARNLGVCLGRLLG